MPRTRTNAPNNAAAAPAGPQVSEVRVHRRTGLMYVWEYVPGTDLLRWLRFDTFSYGMWRMFPRRIAKVADLRRINRAKIGMEAGPITFGRMEFQ